MSIRRLTIEIKKGVQIGAPTQELRMAIPSS